MANVRRRSSARSTTGAGCRCERRTNATSPAAAAARAARTVGLTSPQSSVCTMASTSAPIASASSRAPVRSGHARRPGARLSTRCRALSRHMRTPMGTLTRKTRRQSERSTSSPPTEGPIPAASTAVALQAATACARLRPGFASSTSASDAGTMIAAPAPWNARAAMRVSADGASAQSRDASVNSTMPADNSRLRPSRSGGARRGRAARRTRWRTRSGPTKARRSPCRGRTRAGSETRCPRPCCRRTP